MMYNRSKIFKNAWYYKKSYKLNISEALKKSWFEEKKEVFYKKHIKMINYFANTFSRDHYLDFNMIKSEANLIFHKCFLKYHEKNNFKSYLFNRLRNYLNYYVKQEMKKKEIINNRKINESHFNLSHFLISLNDEIKEVIDTAIKAPSELLELGKSKKVTKDKLYKYYKNKGWSHSKIINAFNQISKNLKEVNYD